MQDAMAVDVVHVAPWTYNYIHLKEHVVPPCVVLVIDDILYGLMVALSYI